FARTPRETPRLTPRLGLQVFRVSFEPPWLPGQITTHVTLAATLAIVPDVPIQSLAILLGIDKFMSECRALTNLIGNGVATIVISRWEGELDVDKLHETMAHPITIGQELETQPG
ncbi:MAG: cation:dicarboxylase symporter family transporter, partial [Pseudolabrys sp.]